MSQPDDMRCCPRCERELSGREHHGEGGLTVIWQCVCGWASARTVSRVEEIRRHRTVSGVSTTPVEGEPPASTKQRR
jgi:hypothetical protein